VGREGEGRKVGGGRVEDGKLQGSRRALNEVSHMFLVAVILTSVQPPSSAGGGVEVGGGIDSR
jgi:hypothetical protein